MTTNRKKFLDTFCVFELKNNFKCKKMILICIILTYHIVTKVTAFKPSTQPQTRTRTVKDEFHQQRRVRTGSQPST